MSDWESQNQLLKKQMKELVGKAQENQTILERFQQFELAMLSAENIADLLQTLLYQSIRHFDLSDCRLIWFDPEQSFRPLIDEHDRKQFGHRLVFSGMTMDVEQLFSKDYVPILRALSPIEKLRWFPGKTHVESAVFLPLVCDGRLMGAFNMGSPERTRFTPDKAVDFMTHMGHIASMCLQNSVIKEQMRLMSLIDNLTQVKNRRSFDMDILKEVSRAQRNQEPLSCIFIDADHFKSINDTYGHQAGDETLVRLAEWSKSQLREGDHIARYGGEEFAVLLPNCDENLACHVAERIRSFVSQQTIQFESVTFQITLSLGVSTFVDGEPYKGMPREQLVKQLLGQADSAVYVAKESGRNRVCLQSFDTAHTLDSIAAE